MKYLFDTNSVIHLLANAYPALTERVGNTQVGEIAMSSISFAEVALGTFRGKPPLQPILEAFVSEVPSSAAISTF
jgi:tRNA(fMet)-specific endonuclease VapC